ncbi:MAG: GAF domain-containing protein, partial [Anaerolineales bacterium]
MNAFFIARWFNDQSIRKKLILTFLAITLVPMGLLAYLSDRATRTALTESAKDALFSVASQTAASIDTFINNDRENVIIESQLPILQNYLSIPAGERENGAIEKEVRELLYNLHNLHASEEPEGKTYLLGYSLLDRSGTIILDTHIPPFTPNPFIGLDWSDRSYYLQTALTGLPYSSPVEVPQDTGDAGIYFAARIINKANQPIGVLVTHYNSIVLQDILAKNNGLAGDGSFGVLFDENLIHLAHGTRPDTIFKTVAPIDENKLAQLQHAKRLPNLPASELFLNLPDLENSLKNVADQPFFTAEDIATGELLNQVAVARLESYPWIVAFFQPQEIFLAPAAQQTANTLLLSAFITIVTVGVGLFAAQTLATPITRLTSTAEEIVTGDLTAQAEATSEDEIGTLARTFNTMTSQLRQTLEGLEQRVAERTALLRTSAEVGQAASSILDPDELIEQTVNLITDRFGYYYAAIFLVDDFGEWAELKGATGEAGKTLKTRSHRLRVGGQSMVGMAVATRRGQIALDVGKEAIRFDNPLLPDTRSEIALPLIAGNRAIGALDVQSTQGAAFGEQDIETLQNMANQVAIAIENARLFQEAQHRLNEISRLNQIFLS